MAAGKIPIEDFLAGQKKVYLRLFSVHYPIVVKKNFWLWMEVLSKPINMLLVHLKKTTDQFLDEGLGRSRGGLTSKIHCLSDEFGNPIELILTGGQVHDSQCAEALLDGKESNFVIADKAYDSRAIVNRIVEMGAIAVIPPKMNRKAIRDFDKHYYKNRNLVERFFCRLKQFRGIATRYCKRGKYFLKAVKFAASIILIT